MRIDPARLSTILLTLSRREEAAADTRPATGTTRLQEGATGAGRDMAALRKRLRARLRGLDPDSGNFDATASTITIQEILSWEFGARIVDHPDFQRITVSITETMLQDERLATSLARLVRELAQAG